MGTRRSWRGQEQLFRELFQPEQPAKRDPVELAQATLDRAKANPLTSPRTLRQLEADVARAKVRALKRR